MLITPNKLEGVLFIGQKAEAMAYRGHALDQPASAQK